MSSLVFSIGGRRESLPGVGAPLPLESLLPDGGRWEVEIGFGKGRFLLATAAANPRDRFLGIEVASKYFRLVESRAARRGLANLLLARGEALYLLSAVLPTAFAAAVHVYFPDPWPKDRHHKRRLFDRDTVDLVLAMLAPGGSLYFASDHVDYGQEVSLLLDSHPAVEVTRRQSWPDGARTNYEMKYEREGRPIVRLEATLTAGAHDLIHPDGTSGIVAAPAEERS